MSRTAITGARIFDGQNWHEDKALVFSNGLIESLAVATDLPADAERVDAAGSLLVPGFIDLQVNGGGGVMLNSEPTVDGIRQICAAHARFGTTALLPTLITDTPEITAATIAAGKQAREMHVPGFLGLHLEGPHLSLSRKGAHDPALIRPMTDTDLDRLLACKGSFEALLITVAAENVTIAQVEKLAAAGFIVSLGHTDTTYDTAVSYAAAGARMVTHLFNAMSPLGHRQPGVVGAALETASLFAGLIADGFHVDPASIGIALRAKKGPGKIFLVTDAMSTIGTELKSFTLNGREILREGGRLTLADGTLAGADIDMLSSVRFIHEKLGLSLDEALRMASLYPAEAVGLQDRYGSLKTGQHASFVVLTPDLDMQSTWIGGDCVYRQA
ncbi:MAG: N-acetylglucosamine-6-phosphate deacetylase [Rhizobium sp. 63-7]|nr:MAG: N-acetylglucosamine-6-phosphate deacetylase [Rhizobium sp. 63-7]